MNEHKLLIKNYSLKEFFCYFLIFGFYSTLIIIPNRNSSFIVPTLFTCFGTLTLFEKNNNINLIKQSKYIIISFIAYSLLSIAIYLYHNDSINYFKDEIILLLSPLMLIYFINANIKQKIIWIIFALSCLIMFFFAIYDKFFLLLDRALEKRQILITSAGIAMNLGLFLFCISIYNLSKKQYYYFTFFIISSICGIITSLLTGSRGTWICLPFIISWIIYINKNQIPRISSIIFLIFGIIILSLLLFYYNKTGLYLRCKEAIYDLILYFNNTNKNTSLGLRLEFWKSAIYGFKDNPFFGCGEINYKLLKEHQYQNNLIIKQAINFTHAHNQFLDVLVKKGIFSFLALIGIYISSLIFFIKKLKSNINKEYKITAQLGIINIIAIFFHSLSDVFLNIKLGAIFFTFTCMLLVGILLKHDMITKNYD